MSQERPLRIAIIGSGAIGCYLGALWAKAGASVSLIGRRGSRPKITHQTIKITGNPSFELDRREIAFSRLTDDVDVIVLAVKSTALDDVIKDIKSLNDKNVPIVCLLNGLQPLIDLRVALPDRKIVAGMVPFNVVWKSGNHLHRSSKGALALGHEKISSQLVGLTQYAGGEAEIQDDIEALQYGKLLLNLINPINALSGLSLAQTLQNKGYRRLYADVVDEALGIYEARGVNFVKASPVPVNLMGALLRLPNFVVNRLLIRIQNIDPDSHTSMAVDYLAKKETEIDNLNGHIVDLAKQAGLDAPLNRRLVHLIKTAPAREYAPVTASDIRAL